MDFVKGVELGRSIFSSLPEGNRLRTREKERWAQENQRDATFADMYLHPQEIDYTVDSLFEMIDASGLDFVGFSNPRTFDLERIIVSNPELLEQAKSVSERDQYRLIELLDPESVTHFEFFLSKPPFKRVDWSDTEALRSATAVMSPCIHGFPSAMVFDRDYVPYDLSPQQQDFLSKILVNPSIGAAMKESGISPDEVRTLISATIIIPTPST